MNLIQDSDCKKKGITLNVQLIDLLSIIDTYPEEEQNQKINEYLSELRERSEAYAEAKTRGPLEAYIYTIRYCLDKMEGISEDEKKQIQDYYRDKLANEGMAICDTNTVKQELQQMGIPPEYHDQMLQLLSSTDFVAKEGVLSLNPYQVRRLHEHILTSGYTDVTIDNAGKFSSYIAIDGKTVCSDPLERCVEFCERHELKPKVNALIFYADYPKHYAKYLEQKVASGEISEEEMKQAMKASLIHYVTDITQRFGDRVATFDMFNEFIYDPGMTENGFEEEKNYHERTSGWQKYLSLEELCKIAVIARKNAPNADFVYNDVHWTDPEKRKMMIEIIQRIQKYQEDFREEPIVMNGQEYTLGPNETLIDTIGLQAHIDTTIDFAQMTETLNDISSEIGLPCELTEIDILRGEDSPADRKQGEGLSEEEKQRAIMARMMLYINSGRIQGVTIWSQSDTLSFLNRFFHDDCHASVLNDDFTPKEFTKMDIAHAMQLEEEHKTAGYKPKRTFELEKVVNMSREELIGLLGEETAELLNEKLKQGTISYQEFVAMFQQAFPISQQGNLVRDLLFLKLSKSECFNMFESDPVKQQQYAQMSELQEKAQKGEITAKELKKLCNIAFGRDPQVAEAVYSAFIASGKVKEDKDNEKDVLGDVH